jgi:rhamnose transport system permease protein
VIAGVLLIGVISSALRLESVTVNVTNIIIGLLLVASVMAPSVLAGLSGLASRRNRPPSDEAANPQIPPVGAETQGR